MNKKVLISVIAAFVVLVGLIVALLVQNRSLNRAFEQVTEEMNYEHEKDSLRAEFEELASQLEGYTTVNIDNDSMAQLLANERQRVQDLLEELRMTKASDTKKIAKLQKELASMRLVLQDYVRQIDVLSQANDSLTAENRAVTARYEMVRSQADSQAAQIRDLDAKVSLASMLEISGFKAIGLNKRDKQTSRLSKIEKVQLNFTIQKNVTAARGMKNMYVRIVRPDGELINCADKGTFLFENVDIEYSIRKNFEYTGEAHSDVMYWTVDEILEDGMYNADFFCDGVMIGSFPFSL